MGRGTRGESPEMTGQEIPNFIRMERDPWAPGKSLLALHYLNHGYCKGSFASKIF